MIAILVIFFITLATTAFILYRKQLGTARQSSAPVLEPPQFNGLFSEQPDDGELDNVEATQVEDAASIRRAALVERARRGDLQALTEAHDTGDVALYGEVLDALVARDEASHEDLFALVKHISQSAEMRATSKLAERVIEAWRARPDRRSTIDMLHMSAVSGSASLYEKAVETALHYWQSGRLAQFSAEDLLSLFESQYWALPPESRRGGEGFALKRRLASVRRELRSVTPAR